MTPRRRGGTAQAVRAALSERWRALAIRAEALAVADELVALVAEGRRSWGSIR